MPAATGAMCAVLSTIRFPHLALAAIVIQTAALTVLGATEPWTFERAIRYASTNSPDAQLAQHRIAAARAQLEQANAALWPRLQLQSGYTHTDNPMLVFGAVLNQRAYSPSLDFNNVPNIDDLNVAGLLTVPIYTGGQTTARRQAAKANTQAARYEAAAIHNALAFEVARAFHSVLKTREFIRATDAAVRAFEKNLGIARSRFEAGTILKTELLDVSVRLAQAREDLVRARNANALAERALRNLLGLETADFAVANTAPEVSAPTGDALAVRPELAAARQRAHAADAAVRGAEGGYRPRLSAFGGLDYDHGWRFNGDGKSYLAGMLAQWDIWDGKLTRGRVNEARAQRDAAREEERKLRLAIDLEVEQARLNLAAAGERLTVTAQSVAQATESVELTRARFEQGLAIATQLIDAETALTMARVRRAEAEADQRIAVAALRQALGQPQVPNQ
ncbi:MAG: TolC family protein [Verrucomicrobia bacterium]|nr:TolC family protein [Verrucomicrobiota bacterium]